ncbi:MAG: hypothetical protein KC417_11290, partial [Myxococcales bacterium]|nr:hypothetical protein [Myxococcales bacterium]
CDGVVDNGVPTQACQTACGSGVQTCSGGQYGACSAPQPSTEVLDGKDNDCDGKVDEGFWVKAHKVTWATLKGFNNGCDSAFSGYANCTAVADAWCRGQGYIGGYGPIDWDDGGTTGAWLVCIGGGGGAKRIAGTVAQLGLNATTVRQRGAQQQAKQWCQDRGYPLVVGPVAWSGNNVDIDILCLPASYGGYYEPVMTVLDAGGCSDINATGNSPICSRAAHLWCKSAHAGTDGVGPLWVWGVAAIECLRDPN